MHLLACMRVCVCTSGGRLLKVHTLTLLHTLTLPLALLDSEL